MKQELLYMNKNRHATWLELYFDLIFVVALGTITHLLTHTHHGHLESGIWWHFILAFIPMWWIWVGHTAYSNRFDADSRSHRIVTLVLMFLILLSSVLLSEQVVTNHVPFVLTYCVARFVIAGMYFTSSLVSSDEPIYARRAAIVVAIGALVSALAATLELSWAMIPFYAGIVIEIIGYLVIRKIAKPVDRDHLVERVGLLGIILLGESVISIGSSLGGIVWDPATILTAIIGFMFICGVWWIYFDSFPLLIESKNDPNGNAILFSQLFTYISFAILANMISHAILEDLAVNDFRIMAAIGMTLFYLGKQTAYFVNLPEYRRDITLNTLAMFAVLAVSLMLSESRNILFGAAFSIGVYIVLNYRAQVRLYGKVHL